MMRRSAAMSALCLLVLSSSALAGSAPAELSCVSESGKVTIKGQIPSPSSEEMALTLDYMKTRLTFNSNKTSGHVVENFRWACSRW